MNDAINNASKADKGMVLRIERASVFDGPGLRTVVFLKGCPLSCQWCSTVESQRFDPQKGYDRTKCVLCGACVNHCPTEAISIVDGALHLDADRCNHCMKCKKVCLQNAYVAYGETMSVEEVVKVIKKDETIYFYSSGGVTLSGGEMLAQPLFSAALLERCRTLGIHTAVETSLYSDYETVERVLAHVDLAYVDIKHMDDGKHREITGVSNQRILENIQRLAASDYAGEIVIRVPVIPGRNDDLDNLKQVVEFVDGLEKIQTLQLLPFHNLGRHTYQLLDLPYAMEGVAIPTQPQNEALLAALQAHSQRITVTL